MLIDKIFFKGIFNISVLVRLIGGVVESINPDERQISRSGEA